MITISVHNHKIPIFQVEIHANKADEDKDRPKLHILACWALAYTSVMYCMQVKSHMVEVFEFSKDRENE